MNDTFQCGNHGALVSYLYGECEPDEQGTIAAHVARCASCAGELEGLSATRRTLATWTPPDMALGFRITRDDSPSTGKVLERQVPWWSAPLPAWAQMAAAMLIFAAGLSIGLARSGETRMQNDSLASTAAPAATPAVSRDDLSRLEQQLRSELTAMRTPSPSASPVPSDRDALMKDVRALIEESEQNQRREFTLRMVDMGHDLEQQRRIDLASVRQSMGQLQGVTNTELRQQRQALDQVNNYLINVSNRPR